MDVGHSFGADWSYGMEDEEEGLEGLEGLDGVEAAEGISGLEETGLDGHQDETLKAQMVSRLMPPAVAALFAGLKPASMNDLAHAVSQGDKVSFSGKASPKQSD